MKCLDTSEFWQHLMSALADFKSLNFLGGFQDMVGAFKMLPDAFNQCNDPETAARGIEMAEKTIQLLEDPTTLIPTVAGNFKQYNGQIQNQINRAVK